VNRPHQADERHLGDLAPGILRVMRGVGAAGLLISIAAAAFSAELRDRFFEAYVVNFAYFLSLALGALFFVLLQHLTRSGWSVVIRRLAEGVATAVLPLAVLFIPLLFGLHHLYHWSDADAVAHDHLLEAKAPYLNVPFFIARWVLYFAVWIALAVWYYRRSVEQDETGNPVLTLRMERLAGPGMILFGFTLTFASFDLLMSIDAHWYSTIYGVYYFSGSVVGVFALLIVVAAFLESRGRLVRTITIDHYHDLGKLLFGFIVFWAYIAFSQYMLIWYANIPEETVWYLRRQTGAWTYVSLALLFGHFLLPFLALISRYPKRRQAMLVAAAAWMLVMHWMDIYWLVRPEFSAEGRIGLHWLDATTFLAVGGLFIEAVTRRLRGSALVPLNDPRLGESLAFRNT
jgi:hypothetical protein